MVRRVVPVGITPIIGLCVLMPSAVVAEGQEAAMTLEPFDLKNVRLTDGPSKVAQEANRKYLHALDPDRMLRNFRLTAGLDAPGEPLGGWEAPTCEVRGHFIGHFLSACALMYRSAGDEALKAKADKMVAEWARCQKAMGGEYLAAYPQDFWDRLEAMKKPPWAPFYTIHKLMAGLYDVYTLCGNEQALDVLKGMAAYFKKRIDKLPLRQWDHVLTVEFGGMSEVLHDLYGVTGDPNHLALAHKFDQGAFLGPLALEWDNLSGIHANTQIPKICGAARRYELTRDERYRKITEFFWGRVVDARSYCTGGSNEHEHWPEPCKLAGTLTDQNQECCTQYNMLKVTRYLLRWTGGARYGDFYERAFYNGILGTQDPADGMLMYFVPLATGHTKRKGGRGFSTPTDSFWCCTGTGIESFAKLGDSIYFHDDDGVYVNLYIPSKLDWPEAGVGLEIQTRYPDEDRVTIVVSLTQERPGFLNLRIPSWADKGVEVKVNDQRLDVEAKPGSYLPIEREWKDGDVVQLRLPMSLRACPMPDDPDLLAIMYGPVVLCGLTDRDRFFIADKANLDAWIKPVEGKPLTFRTTGQQPDMTFIPFHKVLDEAYGVYWPVIKAGSERHKKLLAAEEARRKREARTVDRVLPHDKASESAHNMQGKNTLSGAHQGKGWRHAADGWFGWDLKVLPDVPMTLAVTYWGSDVPPRKFDVLVDDKVIATQSLDRDKPNEFFEVEYKVPPELTRAKQKVTVKFRAHKGNTAGGVFECATMKPE
ncbi:MAG: glycoside hydrolase family 127 protein [Phycisphaerae bacterium]|nr:glycoside hydrolase family 127 protein [Phycisphaerae bacterium]